MPVPTVILAYTGSSKPAWATWDPVPTFSFTKGETTGNQIWSGSCSLSTFALEPSQSDDLIHRSSCMSYCLRVLEEFSWWLRSKYTWALSTSSATKSAKLGYSVTQVYRERCGPCCFNLAQLCRIQLWVVNAYQTQNKHFLSTYCVSSETLNARDTITNEWYGGGGASFSLSFHTSKMRWRKALLCKN